MQDSVEELHFNPFSRDGSELFEYSPTFQTLDRHMDSNQVQPRNRPDPHSQVANAFVAAGSNLSSGTQTYDSGNHSRARTEVGTTSGQYQHHHPLRSAGLAYGDGDAGITRPHLNRALDAVVSVDLSSAVEGKDDGMSQQEEVGADEKTVLVHEISSKDSLAGVALKYGISLTELRRANHLWFSDSIHLRKVLYIPLDKASRSEEFMASSVKTTIPLSSSVDDSALLSDSIQKSPVDGDNQTNNHTSDASSAPTIRRIPASELSFFPPPSKPSVLDSPLSEPAPPKNIPAPKPYHVRSATSPPPSLNSILTALPIAASTRDTIIARLSFDSPGSSYSDREREWWQRGDTEGEGHELDDVRARRHSRHASEDGLRDRRQFAFKDGSRNSLFGATPRARASYDNPTRNYAEEYTGPSRTAESFSLARVRNVQLEPSPVMQLPDVSSMAIMSDLRRGKARPRSIDADLGSTDSLNSTQQVDG